MKPQWAGDRRLRPMNDAQWIQINTEITTWPLPYLALTSWAAMSTDRTEPTSRCSRSTWASGCEVSRAARAAKARCVFLQARHKRSWLSSLSSLSHRARPMPLWSRQQGVTYPVQGQKPQESTGYLVTELIPTFWKPLSLISVALVHVDARLYGLYV